MPKPKGGSGGILFPNQGFPQEDWPTGMSFTVTGSSGTYTGTAKATLKAGKYYPVELILSKQ